MVCYLSVIWILEVVHILEVENDYGKVNQGHVVHPLCRGCPYQRVCYRRLHYTTLPLLIHHGVLALESYGIEKELRISLHSVYIQI